MLIPVLGIMEPVHGHVGVQQWPLGSTMRVGQTKVQDATIKKQHVRTWWYQIIPNVMIKLFQTVVVATRAVFRHKIQLMRPVNEGRLSHIVDRGTSWRKNVDICLVDGSGSGEFSDKCGVSACISWSAPPGKLTIPPTIPDFTSW
jgi:hypothetical protein